MSDTLDWMFGGTASEEPAKEQQDTLDWMFNAPSDDFSRSVTETDLQPGGEIDVRGRMVGSFASDRNELMRFYAQELFGDPNATDRIQQTREGRLYYLDDDNVPRRVLNQGWSPGAIAGSVAEGVGPSIPGALDVVGGTVGAAAGPFGMYGGTVAGGAGGEFLRQYIGDQLMGDAATYDYNVGQMVREGTLSLAGQGVGSAIDAYARAGRVPEFSRIDPAATEASYQQADRQGVAITPGEASGSPSLLAEQQRISNVPAAADVMDQFYRERGDRAIDRFDEVVDGIGRMGDPEEVLRRAQDTATEAVDAAHKYRTSISGPYYTRARAESTAVDASRVAANIENQMQTAKGEIYDVLSKARDTLNFRGTDQLDDTVEGLMSSRQEIRRIMGDPMSTASQDKNVRRLLGQTMNDLDVLLARASDEYYRGNRIYQSLSPHVTELEASVVGALRKAKPDERLFNTVKRMIDPASGITPAGVRRAKKAFLSQGPAGEQAWNDVSALFIHNKVYNALNEAQKGAINNIPGKIQAQFPSIGRGTMQNVEAALGPQRFAEFEDMIDLYRKIAGSDYTNSQTAFMQARQQIAKDRAAPGWAKTMSVLNNPLSMSKRLEEWVIERNYTRDAVRMAEIITGGDREALTRLRELRRFPPRIQQYLLGHLIAEGVAHGVGSAVGEPVGGFHTGGGF